MEGLRDGSTNGLFRKEKSPVDKDVVKQILAQAQNNFTWQMTMAYYIMRKLKED